MADEVWRDVPEWEDAYAVSSHGRVHSKKRGIFLKPHVDRDGYLRVTLFSKPRKWVVGVHQLVCLAFHGPSRGRWALHKDDNPDNNKPDNLYWGTPSDNQVDAHHNGCSVQRGERNNNAKLNDFVADLVRSLRKDGLTLREISADTGVSRSNVKHILYGESWASKS